MNAEISATALRANIFQILEQSFQSGETLKIKLKDKIFSLIPERKERKKNFSFDTFKGNPDAIIEKDDLDTYVTPTEWNEAKLV